MEDLTYHLEGILKTKDDIQDFEGPLTLILMLLQKNKIEIRDIVISDILDQYTDYLNQMEKMDLEIASEFVQMAAYLLYIKTKMLLTEEKEVTELELLIQSLEQMKAKDIQNTLQQIVPEIKERYDRGVLYFSKQPEPIKIGNRQYEYHHESVDLLSSILDVFTRGSSTPAIQSITDAAPKYTPYGVREKSKELITKLKSSKHVNLNTLYSDCSTKSEVVATFISVLELCSMGSLLVTRDDNEEYILTFVGGNIDSILDKIEIE